MGVKGKVKRHVKKHRRRIREETEDIKKRAYLKQQSTAVEKSIGKHQDALKTEGISDKQKRDYWVAIAKDFDKLAKLSPGDDVDQNAVCYRNSGDAYLEAASLDGGKKYINKAAKEFGKYKNSRRAGINQDHLLLDIEQREMADRAASIYSSAHDRKKGLEGKATTVVITLAAFILSIFYAANSFTGYVVNETVNMTANWTAFAFFVVGIIGASYLLRRH
jgi:hypothetical protein